MGLTAETVAMNNEVENVRRNDGQENASARERPGPSSTVTSGALQAMSPSTGAIRKTTVATSSKINRIQQAVGSDNMRAATPNTPERQNVMEVDSDNESMVEKYAEMAVESSSEAGSDGTIVFEEWREDDDEEQVDLQAELNEMLAQSAAEHEAARAARNRRSPLPTWPPRDPNAPTVTDARPPCYRRGERFMPYDLQIIVMNRMSEVFAAAANGRPSPRHGNITIEERRAVQRQLDLQAEMDMAAENVNQAPAMREIELFDFVEPARLPPVPMPQDQPEFQQQYDVPCVCCTERKVNTIYMPCRHAVCCWTCAMEGEYYGIPCYICREMPELRVTMYGP
jgi:hypothetical protein